MPFHCGGETEMRLVDGKLVPSLPWDDRRLQFSSAVTSIKAGPATNPVNPKDEKAPKKN